MATEETGNQIAASYSWVKFFWMAMMFFFNLSLDLIPTNIVGFIPVEATA